MFFNKVSLFVGLVLLSSIVVAEGAALEHPLLVAWKLGDGKFPGWYYGSRAEERQINCVQFLAEVVEELLQRKLHKHERDALMIQNYRRRENVQRLVKRRDPRIRGIQRALVNMGRGVVVTPANARPGDFVQYWYKKEGVWLGHAAIIQEIREEAGKYCAFIYGAHESTNNIGVAGYQITLNDPLMKVYLVRFK